VMFLKIQFFLHVTVRRIINNYGRVGGNDFDRKVRLCLPIDRGQRRNRHAILDMTCLLKYQLTFLQPTGHVMHQQV